MRGFGRIAFRVWLCAAIGQALALVAFFNGLEDTRSAEVERQLQTMVERVLAPASARSALGYPLEYQGELQSLIEDLSGIGKGAAELYVLDPDGVVVFASEPGMIGTKAPARWLPQGASRNETWFRAGDDETIAGATIRDAVAEKAGTVVARSLRRNVLVGLLSVLRLPVVSAVVFLSLAALMALAGVALAVKPLSRRIDEAAARHETAVRAVRAGKLPDDDGSPVTTAVRQAMVGLAQTEHRGHRVDAIAPEAGASAAAASVSEATAGPAPAKEEAMTA